MKKLIVTVGIFLLAVSPTIAKGQGDDEQNPAMYGSDDESTGYEVKNEVKTQNEGEDDHLMVNTQESLDANDQASGSGNKSEVARQNMSEVAKQVKGLLEFKEDAKGIGTQVREIAQAQSIAQEEISLELDKLDNRGKVVKFLLGSDPKAIKNLNQQMEHNQLRIQQLEELKTQVANQADETQIEEAIQAMIDQNTALSEQINNEEQVKGLFGWLVRMFVK